MAQMNLRPQTKGDDGRDDVEEQRIARHWYRDMVSRVLEDSRVILDLEEPADRAEFYILDHESGGLRPFFTPGRADEELDIGQWDLCWEMYRRARDGELLVRGMGEDQLRALRVGEDHMCLISNSVENMSCNGCRQRIHRIEKPQKEHGSNAYVGCFARWVHGSQRQVPA